MGASHSHRADPAPPQVRRIMTAVMVPLVVVTIVAMVLLWPDRPQSPDPAGATIYYDATVTEVFEQACPEAQEGFVRLRCGTVTVRLDEGPDSGREVTTDVPDGPGAPTVRVGDKVIMVPLFDPGDPAATRFAIADHQRANPLILLVILFAVAIIGFGRLRGVAALAGLTACFTLLLTFVLPAIIAGQSPLLIAVVGAAMVIFVVMYLVHGISVRTSVAVLGTLGALVITGVLGALATAATHLTGFGGDDARLLSIFDQTLDLRGVLLAGIIIGSLGVLDDVTVTQAATVGEISRANPDLSRRQLYLAGTRVGRAHIASVVNTIVLAYAGASLPLLLLIVASNQSGMGVLTNQFLAQEIVRSVVATIGLVAAVPITTGLAAVVCGARPAGDAQPHRDLPESRDGAGRAAHAASRSHRLSPGEAVVGRFEQDASGWEPAPWDSDRR